jgi:hypothetical protein
MSDNRTVNAADLALFRRDFEHEDQVQLCARHLELMREDMGDEWGTWTLVKPGNRLKALITPSRTGWTLERIDLAGHFVRHASESSDHEATVDFITYKTLDIIKRSRALYPRRKKRGYHLNQWKLFTHEHMVPGAAVLRVLTDPGYTPNQGRLYELLSAMSFRALVTGTKSKREDANADNELAQLDTLYSSRLPEPKDVPGWLGPLSLHQVPACHYAFMRYDAAGLLDELIALNPRAERALANYRAYKKSFDSTDAQLAA